MKKTLALMLVLMLIFGSAVSVTAEEDGPLAGKLVILHTNDVHGHGVADSAAFGYARIAAVKQSLKARGADVLLLDAGDFFQGMPLVNLQTGKPAVTFMNAAGYDAVTLGNHEFDWGVDNLLLNLEDAEFAVVCANLIRATDKTSVFAANKIFDTVIGKVGVFGLATPETKTKARPDRVRSIDISQGEELYADARAQVGELKAAGCDYIVCLAHLGILPLSEPNRSTDLLANVTGIDLLIDGHSHDEVQDRVGDALLVSAGYYFRNIGFVILSKDGEGVTADTGLYAIGVDDVAVFLGEGGIPEDEYTADTVNALDAETDKMLGAVFARSDVVLNGNKESGIRTRETNLGDFCADAVLWAARNALGDDKADAALINSGGIRDSIEAGDITMKTLETVFPFDNTVVTVTLTGAELLEAMEAATFGTPVAVGSFPQVAGIQMTIDTTVPYEKGELYPDSTYYAPARPGSRVTIASVNGRPWEADGEYIIATNDYVAAGGGVYSVFRYPNVMNGYNTNIMLVDALVNYVRSLPGGVIGEDYAEPKGRITIK